MAKMSESLHGDVLFVLTWNIMTTSKSPTDRQFLPGFTVLMGSLEYSIQRVQQNLFPEQARGLRAPE